jgi:hypothetical protein
MPRRGEVAAVRSRSVAEKSEQPTQVILPPQERRGGWLFGNPRPHDELVRDPGLLLAIGQLSTGAALVADWLIQRDDPESQAMGARLARVAGWYFQDAKEVKR